MIVAFPFIVLLTFLILGGIVEWWGEDIEWQEDGNLWIVHADSRQSRRQ